MNDGKEYQKVSRAMGLRVLIGDDHAIVRRGIAQVLRDNYSGVETGEAEDGLTMIRLAEVQQWNLCIMDISMPGKSGTELLESLKRIQPATPVLVFSMYPEATYGVRMIRSGAMGYVNKASGAEELMKSVATILSGRRYITPQVADGLIEALRPPSCPETHCLLSNREFEVMRMLAQGMALKEIAGQLSVSASTISTYRARILEKLGVKSNVELSRYAHEHSLLT
jgi:DNA-binding NarL/FixJ family response regulator